MKRSCFIRIGIVLCLLGGVLYIRKIHNETWQQAYGKVLQRGYTDDGIAFDSNYFALFDFNTDGTPELLLPGYKDKESAEWQFANGYDICSQTYTIVSYIDGHAKVVFQDTTDFIDMRYNLQDNHLLDWHPNGMGMSIATYQFNGMEFCESMYAFYSMEEPGVEVFQYENGEEISRDIWIDFEGEPIDAVAEEPQCFRYYELSDENIEKICKGEIE